MSKAPGRIVALVTAALAVLAVDAVATDFVFRGFMPQVGPCALVQMSTHAWWTTYPTRGFPAIGIGFAACLTLACLGGALRLERRYEQLAFAGVISGATWAAVLDCLQYGWLRRVLWIRPVDVTLSVASLVVILMAGFMCARALLRLREEDPE